MWNKAMVVCTILITASGGFLEGGGQVFKTNVS